MSAQANALLTITDTTFKRKKDIRAEIDTKLDAIANALQATPSITPILTLRWTVNE
jgi:hypothetical protein